MGVLINCALYSKFPPNLNPTKGCRYPGLFAEIIKLLADYLNATIQIHTMYENESVTDKLYIGRIVSFQIECVLKIKATKKERSENVFSRIFANIAVFNKNG